MINIYIVILILFCHWAFDFLCQTDWMAQNKSSNNEALVAHTITYSAGWIAPMIVLIGQKAGYFVLITFICHTITDYFTSRWVKKSFDKKDFHWGFVKIGIDQFSHFVQLLLTFYWLNQIK